MLRRMDQRIDIVRGFCAAWTDATAPALAEWFAEDGIYHNIPLAPVVGRPAIETEIARFLAIMSIDIRILHVAATDTVVMTERVDAFTINGRRLDLPVMGTCELRGDKLAAWRDYYDSTAVRAFMSGAA
jgi:limonene-1,2-epoxide hydrolase